MKAKIEKFFENNRKLLRQIFNYYPKEPSCYEGFVYVSMRIRGKVVRFLGKANIEFYYNHSDLVWRIHFINKKVPYWIESYETIQMIQFSLKLKVPQPNYI